MSVASRNPFALLGDDGEAPAAVPAKKTDSVPTTTAARPARDIPGAGSRGARVGAAGAPRGGRGGARGGAAAPSADETREGRELRSSDRGRGAPRGGRGRGRGGRGREFDRHSQTARVDSDKAIAQGWGGEDPVRELNAEEKAAEDAAAEEKSGAATPANGEAKPEGEAAADGAAAPAAPVEEVDNTKTLDQYLAEQAEKKAKLGGNSQAPRAADEWKDFVGKELKKGSEDSESYFAATVKDSSKGHKARKEKQLVEIDTHFEAPAGERGGDRGGRGGRGGARGGRGRGDFRGADRGGRGGPGRGAARGGAGAGRGRGQAGAGVNLNDNTAFPTLGA